VAWTHARMRTTRPATVVFALHLLCGGQAGTRRHSRSTDLRRRRTSLSPLRKLPLKKKSRVLALVLAIASISAAVSPGSGLADTSPIAATSAAPWADPAHHSSLEVLAGQIASQIAHRQVTIACEGANDWRTLVSQVGGDPNAVAGYVDARWEPSGRLFDISSFAEILGSVCLKLQNFALAASKPTKCSVSSPQETRMYKPQRVQRQVSVRVHGKLVHTWVWKLASFRRR
jgi:hypothetical protein